MNSSGHTGQPKASWEANRAQGLTTTASTTTTETGVKATAWETRAMAEQDRVEQDGCWVQGLSGGKAG